MHYCPGTTIVDFLPVYAVFRRATGEFWAFMRAEPETMMAYHRSNYLWYNLSAGQSDRLHTLTDADNHINATAKIVGSHKVRIYSY